jgi:uroporphyrinogen III methyltransferase / synthase
MRSKTGTVYLVGAGPGDPGLLTVRGAELLRQADVVVYDALVNPDLLKLAPPGAEIIYAGKRAKDHAILQGDLNKLLVEKARAGKRVLRLKGGDPYVFGRGGEEAEELAEAGIPFEVVPGISSAVAAPSYAGIPLTHRAHSSAFTVITGHEDPEKEGSGLDYAHLAQAPGTKVILMGAERIGPIAEQLVRHGMPPSTPAAIIRWGTMSQQASVQGTIADIAELAEKAGITAPAVTVLGEVVSLRPQLNWFEKRPLLGQRMVVTRTREQASQLSGMLQELGADVLEIPTIRMAPPEGKEELKDAILGLNSYDWIVFTSPNGVTAFFNWFFQAFDDLRDLGGARIAAVGPGTAAKLRELRLKVDLMPEEYIGAKIAEAFQQYQSVENLNILLMRAEVANRELPRALEEMGAIVDDVGCYRTLPEEEDRTGAAARFVEGGAEWITFTSSSTVTHFHQRFNLPAMLKKFPGIKLAAIGPETSKTLKALGLPPTVEAPVHTLEGMVEAILENQQKKS